MATVHDFTHHFEAAQNDAAPVLLMLHGTGGNERDLLDLGRMLAPDAALLSPRGKTLENGMPRFFRRLAEGVFDLEDLRFRTHELADWIQVATEHYGVNERKLIALGYSNGANIAASVLLLQPGVLHGAVLLRPMVPLQPEQQPDLAATQVLIRGGRFDQLVPPRGSEQLAELLRSAGADVALQWHAGGHELGMDDVRGAQTWLSARLKVEG
jgi:phospholipase/carboxylesterase/glyoxalase family protein